MDAPARAYTDTRGWNDVLPRHICRVAHEQGNAFGDIFDERAKGTPPSGFGHSERQHDSLSFDKGVLSARNSKALVVTRQ